MMLCVGTIACDGRSLGTEDGALTPDRGALTMDAGPLTPDLPPPKPDMGPGDETCVVAIRTDNCCTSAQPLKASEVASDPCLELWPPTFPVAEACTDRWDPECTRLDCMSAPPPTRVAIAVDGQCQFAEECDTDDDCLIAVNMRACCSCGDAYPKALLLLNPCLRPPSRSHVPEGCLDDCSTVRCDGCVPPYAAECVHGDDYNRCEPLWIN